MAGQINTYSNVDTRAKDENKILKFSFTWFIGGFIGTLMMTLMMYFVAPIMMGQAMDIAAMLSSQMGTSWTMGMVAHFILGAVVFPITLGVITKSFSVTTGSSIYNGLIFGIGLWFIAMVAVMPMMGKGLFMSAGGGMMAAVGSLMGHLVYGLLLGWIGKFK